MVSSRCSPGTGVSSAAVRLTASGWAVLAAGGGRRIAPASGRGFGKDVERG